MSKLELCENGLQHCWVILPKGKGLECYSCPMCGQLVYWSEATLSWIKPALSGGKNIPGNVKDRPVLKRPKANPTRGIPNA